MGPGPAAGMGSPGPTGGAPTRGHKYLVRPVGAYCGQLVPTAASLVPTAAHYGCREVTCSAELTLGF